MKYHIGTIDDVRLYDQALNEEQLLAVIEGEDAGFSFSSNPEPADGAIHESTWANLNWTGGDSAVSHDVYLGDNYDDVNDGTGDTFWGNQAETELLAVAILPI